MNVFQALFSSLFRNCFLAIALAALPAMAQPVDAPSISIDELRPGQRGEVWTVFQGRDPEPFEVEVTGVIRNALGPGKSLILCQLTDPRVQKMGAVAGMSGSPLYIEGRLAGALSYQIQKFETVRYAGFTPIQDLLEVSQLGKPDHGGVPAPSNFIPLERDADSSKNNAPSSPATPRASLESDGFAPLTPVFALGGVAPQVASLFGDRLQALGLNVTAIGGSTNGTTSSDANAEAAAKLAPGSSVAVALSTGDITLAGTGTVSHVDGNRILAFGHPLMSLGNVELPMALAEIVAILPSSLNSFKIANTGAVIGTISQDRLSAIYGEVGHAPEMLPIEVKTPRRTLHFNAVRHPRLTPMIASMGLTQAVIGSNENGLAEGFRISSTVNYPGGEQLHSETIYAGPQGFAAGLDGFVRRLTASLQNPLAKTFPTAIAFTVEPLARNPISNLDLVQLSRSRVHPGDELTVTLTVRDFQGEPIREIVSVPVASKWLGRKLELVVLSGDDLDRMAGRPDTVSVSQIRTFPAYLEAMRRERQDDGLYVAVVERTSAFSDQAQSTLEYPGSVERIARASDDERFRRTDVLVPLWEQHILPGRLFEASVRRPLQITD